MQKITVFWIPGTIKKISVFLFLLAAVVFIIFIIGNFQEFLDSTQLVVLNIFEIIAAAFIISGIYHIIFTIVMMVRSRTQEFISLGITLAGEAIVISFFLLSNIIIAVTKTVN